ncbi:uncharacterized protein LOC135841121 isoform X3 [Planococcus citri]|uniref:uncharacterized protein LOC135841121 isoform X3 n=1 Tax=Planococcus citri TaxID=170843 RepID=UPI0031F9B921
MFEAMEVVNVDLDLDNERLFVFHESVSTLQHIASHTVVLQLCDTVLNLDQSYESESKKLVELLKTPKSIEEILKSSLKNIHSQIGRWIHHFEYDIFTCTSRIYRYRLKNFQLNHVVWHQDYKIDYKKSASKMITEGTLDAEQKFILMCAYGMNQELERFPMDSLPMLFCLRGISEFIVAYWISYHRNDLREVWLRMPDVIRPEDASINVTMAVEYAKRSLPYAFEYFWNCLNEDEQMSVAVRILPHQWFEILKIVLSTMSPFQQCQLIDRIAIKLLMYFCSCRMLKYAFIIWTRIQHTITELQFGEFLKTVVRDAMYSEESMVMLTNVWDTASDHLKKHIIEINPGIIFSPFMTSHRFYEVPSPSMYRFFMKFLPLVNEDNRKNLIFSLNVEFLLDRRPDVEILKLCLPKESDLLQFKNRILESPIVVDHYAEWVSSALLDNTEFDEAITMVEFYSQNARVAYKFYKKLLKSERFSPLSFILDYEKWNKLSDFIDAVFTNYDLSTVSRLKKRLLSSFSVRAVHYWNEEKYVGALVQISEQVFPTDELKPFKQTLLKHFQEMISSRTSWRDFEGKCFNTFVSWCLDEESRIIEFKSIVPIDAFFDNTFRTICSSVDNNPGKLLYELNDFLRYFCTNNEEVELVKIRKYYESDQYWIRKVEQNFVGDVRRRIVNWFFENCY